MATELILPRVDMDMTEGKIARWYVKNGDTVSKGQVVFEIETDKAMMEVEAPSDGIVQGIEGEVDVTLPVGKIVGWILHAGEAIPGGAAHVDAASDPATVFVREAHDQGTTAEVPYAEPFTEVPMPTGASRPALLRATPLARSVAREQGIDLRSIGGSGPDGRILRADLPAAPAGSTVPVSSPDHRLNLRWFSSGPGAPVVMLHGFGTSLGSWRPLSLELEDLPLVGIDLPNHGKSPRLPTRDLSTMATSVLRRLDEEGIRSMHLLGHSLGGGTALALADMLGDRLKSLTLIAPLSMGPEMNGSFVQGLLRASREQSVRPWLMQLFGDAAGLSGSFVAMAWKELESPERRAGLAELADRLLPDGTQAEIQRARLDRFKVPVKIIWGTLDRIVPYHQSGGLPAQVALHSMAGIGHLPHVEAVATVAALVRQQVAAAGADITHVD